MANPVAWLSDAVLVRLPHYGAETLVETNVCRLRRAAEGGGFEYALIAEVRADVRKEANRDPRARYRVHHADGHSDIALDQRAPQRLRRRCRSSIRSTASSTSRSTSPAYETPDASHSSLQTAVGNTKAGNSAPAAMSFSCT